MLDHWSDYLSITWNCCFGITGVVFNAILIFFVFKHTPDYMRVYATVIQVGAIGDTISSFCAVMSSARAYVSGVSLILMFHGVAKYLPIDRSNLPYVCFFLFSFEIHGYIFSLLVILFSLFYRLRAITHYQKSMSQLQVNIICYGFGILVIVFTSWIATGGPPLSVFDEVVRKVRPELIGSNWVYYVLLNVSDGITETLILGLNCIALVFGIYCRTRINKELISIPMSTGLKEMHKSLMTILLIQILAAFTQLLALLIYYMSKKRNDLQTPLIENLIEAQEVVLGSVTPIVTFYHVKTYRVALAKLFRTSRIMPSIQVSMIPVESTHQI